MPTVRPFDPHTATREEWLGYHALRRVLFIEESPERLVPEDARIEARLREDDPHWQLRQWLAWDGAQAVGTLQLATRCGEDPSRYAGRVYIKGGVAPSRRRQGIGTALAQQLADVMRAESQATAFFPLPSLELGGGFLETLGARRAYREIDNRLRLEEAPWLALDRWVAALPAGVRWEVHTPRVSLERLHAIAPALTRMLADIPREDLDSPPPLFEVASYEAMYRRMDERGGAHLMVLLVAGDELAAACDSTLDATSPEIATQLFTGVAKAWRGHGLAHAVKARTLQLLRDRQPPVRLVQAQNAASNAPMLRVNADVGFRAFREMGIYEVARERLEHALAASRHGGRC